MNTETDVERMLKGLAEARKMVAEMEIDKRSAELRDNLDIMLENLLPLMNWLAEEELLDGCFWVDDKHFSFKVDEVCINGGFQLNGHEIISSSVEMPVIKW